MWLTNWLRSWKRIAAPSPRPAQRSKAPTTQLFLEPLEDRTLPSAGWASATTGTGTFSNIEHISQADASGDHYVTGYFNGTATFGSTTLTATANNTSFVAKVDANGDFIWAKQFGGVSSNAWTGIATDANGNVYLSGDFDGTQSFGGTSLTSTGPNVTGYICKVDSNGNFKWAQEFANGTNGSHSEALAVDGSGNPYVTWWSDSGTPGEGFLSRYDTNGNFQWTQRLASNTTAVSVWCITLDSSGNAYVGGYGQVSGSPAPGGFLAEYDTNGIQIGTTQLTPRPVMADAIYQDSSGRNWLYAAMWPTTAMPTDVEKIDLGTGAVQWSKQIGSPSLSPRAIGVDANGNVYLTGAFGGTVDFDPGPGVAAVTAQSTAGNDVYVLKLDPSGNFLSVRDSGPTPGDVYGLALDPSGNAYTVGVFSGTMTFDTGDQVVPLTTSSNSGLYVAKTTQDTGMIFGRVFNDLNGNGVLDSGSLEVGIPNVTVYLDLNNSGSYVAGDPTATTDAQGFYHFTDVTPGNYTVRQVAPSGYTVSPASFQVSVVAGQASELGSSADHTNNKTYPSYTNTTAVNTSKGKPNATSSLTVAANPDYTVLGINLSLTVNDPSNNTLTIFLTGPNGTKIDVGSTSQSGTLTFPLTGFDYLAVNGKWTLEVDGLGQGGQLTKWSLSVDGTA